MKNLKAFNFDLQLFAGNGDEFEEDGELLDEETNDETDVVDPVESDIEDGEDFEEEGEKEEVADPQESKQTPEENTRMKNMRLKAEEDARKKLQAERDEFEKMRLELQIEREATAEKNKITQDAIWEKADSEGISESAAKKLLEHEVENKVSQIKQRFETVHKQKEELKKDSFYNDIAPKMEQILKDRPELEPQTVFYFLKGQMGDELYKKTVDNTKKKTVANIQDSMRRRSVPASGSGDVAGDTSILSSEGKEMTNAFGVDPRTVAKYVRSAIKKK